MSDPKTSVILHYSKETHTDTTIFLKTIRSVFNQTNKNLEIIVIHDGIDSDLKKRIDEINTEAAALQYQAVSDGSKVTKINKALESAIGAYVLYLDNENTPIYLKRAALDVFMLVTNKVKNSGLNVEK